MFNGQHTAFRVECRRSSAVTLQFFLQGVPLKQIFSYSVFDVGVAVFILHVVSPVPLLEAGYHWMAEILKQLH